MLCATVAACLLAQGAPAGANLLDTAAGLAQKGDALVQKASSLYEQLVGYVELARGIVRVAKGYAPKLAELRRKRALPSPLGSTPAAKYKTAAGQLELLQKAELLAGTTRKHVHDKLLITGTDLHPQTFELLRFFNGVGDAGAHHGMYLAALAYRYGVTGAADHRAEFLDTILGAYNQLTVTSAPDGFVFDVRSGQRLPARAGLPVRGYGNIASPLVRDMADLAKTNASVFGYEGSLAGLPRAVYHFNSDISRDELDGIFFGLGAALEVLDKRGEEPALRARVAAAMVQTLRYLAQNGYKFIDFTGKVALWGDQSSFTRDPTLAFNNLSWLATAARFSGDAWVTAEMKRFADKYFGKARFLKAGLWLGVLGLAREALQGFPELIGYTLNSYNHHLMAMYLHNLWRDAPDAGLRALAIDWLQSFAWPLAEQARVPFFDYLYQNLTGKRDAVLLDRALWTLGQVRGAPFPRGNPANATEYVTDFSTRADLVDPLWAYLKGEWASLRKLLPGNPEGPLNYGGSVWPLGPGLVPKSNFIERASAYELRGEEPYAWSWTGEQKNLRGYPAHDYLLSYWYGRYYGLIAPVAQTGTGLDAVKTRAVGTAQRLVGELKGAVMNVLQSARNWVVGLVHRLESNERCVSQHVRPLADNTAGAVRTQAETKARAFFAELGPSLQTLSWTDRPLVVDYPWGLLVQSVQQRFAEVKAEGERVIAPWFGKASNREAALSLLRGQTDAAQTATLTSLRALYEAALPRPTR